MSDIYYGRVAHPWAIHIEDWTIDVNEQLCLQEYEAEVGKYLVQQN
jgi:hypothetical protein